MSVAEETLNKGIRRVILSQVIVTAFVAGAFLLWPALKDGTAPEIFKGLSALYGGGVTVFSTWWLGRSVRRAGERARHDANAGKMALYMGAAQRFVTIPI